MLRQYRHRWTANAGVRAATILLLNLAANGRREGVHWNQFRGPNGQGVCPAARIPVNFGPEQNVVWKTTVPAGHSSPALWSNRIFLTASEPADPTELITLALDREGGNVLWRRAVQAETRGRFHPLNNAASSTPAVDDKHVYVYFGTYGLLCYDHAGREVWQRKIATPPSKYGVATSPILYQDKVILVLDGDGGSSRLLAVRRDTGATVWEQPRPLFRAGWSTPMIFRHDEVDELVVLGSKRLTAYNPVTGAEIWWAGGFPDETVGIPVTGEGLLFASAAALGGRGDEALDAAATWKTTVDEFDRNHDNQIQREEMTKGFAFIQRPELPRDNPGYGLPVRDMDMLLRIFDHDKNGTISEKEWMATMASFAALSHPTLMAIRPGATRDARPSHVAWEIQHGIPETPSLLYYRGRLHLVRDGGLLTCLEAATGKELFRERIGASGQYTASPIVAGDKLVVASVPGVVTVIQVGDQLKVLARNDFREQIFATPAVAENWLYLRTVGHLYALGE
jgi:outer membrane protein assembly factor BamB